MNLITLNKNVVPLKILMLGDSSNPHIIKWANSLAGEKIDLTLFTVSKFSQDDYSDKINIISFSFSEKIKSRKSGSLLKLSYLLSIFKLKKLISKIKPDIIHAHYASSYGLLAALANCKPFYLSVWGIDITIFPTRSLANKLVLKYILRKADKVFATSDYLAKETHNYTNKEITILPFGVDTERFRALEVSNEHGKNEIVIGTVKSLEAKYGIEALIKVFAELSAKYLHKNLRLLLVGGGNLESHYRKLVSELGIIDKTIFAGRVNHSEVQIYHNKLDVAVYLSEYESFGVSILESMACEKPVVVANVGGLPEIVTHGVNGYIVQKGNKESIFIAIEDLVNDEKKRIETGKLGRKFVTENYQWDKCVNDMISYYTKEISF